MEVRLNISSGRRSRDLDITREGTVGQPEVLIADVIGAACRADGYKMEYIIAHLQNLSQAVEPL